MSSRRDRRRTDQSRSSSSSSGAKQGQAETSRTAVQAPGAAAVAPLARADLGAGTRAAALAAQPLIVKVVPDAVVDAVAVVHGETEVAVAAGQGAD